MKWEVTTRTPKGNAVKAARAFTVQVYVLARPYKKEFNYFGKEEEFILHFKGSHKAYLRTETIVTKFNLDMETITRGRIFRRGSKAWTAEYKAWAIETFYTDPAKLEITEEPTVEDYQEDEKGLLDKIKSFVRGKK